MEPSPNEPHAVHLPASGRAWDATLGRLGVRWGGVVGFGLIGGVFFDPRRGSRARASRSSQ